MRSRSLTIACACALATISALAAAQGPKPQYGAWGYDIAGADTATRPGNDFFRYANGTWIDKTEIPGDKWWAGENAPPGTAIAYYLKNAGMGEAKITIADAVTGQEVRTQTAPSNAGLNRWQWNLCGNPPATATAVGGFGGGGGRGGGVCQGARVAPVGTYRVTVAVGGKEVGSETFKVLEDIWLNER